VEGGCDDGAEGGVRDGRGVEKLGSVGDPARVVGVPGTVDWQPVSSAPVHSRLTTKLRAPTMDNRKMPSPISSIRVSKLAMHTIVRHVRQRR